MFSEKALKMSKVRMTIAIFAISMNFVRIC